MRPSVSSILRRFPRNNPSSMKLPTTSTAFAALCAASCSSTALAWITPPTPRYTSLSSNNRQFFTWLKSAVAPDEEVSSNVGVAPALQPMGASVAQGTVVSHFRGGLAAVQVNDDDIFTKDGVSSSSSQSDDLIGRQVLFPNGKAGMVVAQRPPILFCYFDDTNSDDEDYVGGDGKVQILDSMAQVQVSDTMQMVDCFGRPFDTTSSNKAPSFPRDIFGAIPKVADIALINSPMLTGETMIDALAPIGRGQNMLVVGSDLQDMRGLATDFIATQLKEYVDTTKCIYAITHDKEEALERLKAAGVLEKTVVVSVRNDEEMTDPATRAAEAVAVAATACAIGESFARDEGQDSLVIVDTIDSFKLLWDTTTRVLVDVFGVDSVVKDDRNGGASSEMRAFYSSLIQRAGQFKESKGGGSVTLTLLTSIPGDGGTDESTVHEVSEFDDCSDKIKARLDVLVKKNIPLTAANLRKIGIPIPSVTEGQKRLVLQHIDDLISMSDGQIWFDERLAQAGQRPPMDPQKSITRVGIGADTESRADAPAVRRMVEGLRLDLSQAASMDGAEATSASTKQTRKRNAWLLAMHQEPGQGGRTLAESCIALLAASTGALDDTIDAGGLAGTEKGQSTMQELIAHVKTTAPDAVKEIDDTLDISATSRAKLVDATESFFSS